MSCKSMFPTFGRFLRSRSCRVGGLPRPYVSCCGGSCVAGVATALTMRAVIHVPRAVGSLPGPSPAKAGSAATPARRVAPSPSPHRQGHGRLPRPRHGWTAVSPSRNRSLSRSDGMRSSWPGSGCGQTWSVGMIHSSPMAVWRGRVTMSATPSAMSSGARTSVCS
jgi:hypothetical protein